MLRQARQAAGLHIAALAVALKVPVAKLDALESDRAERLPDAVFTRALAASVCRTLKIDPGPVLDRLPSAAAPRLAQQPGGRPMPVRGRDAVPSLRPPWRVLGVTAFLLVLAAAAYFAPRLRTGPDAAPGPGAAASAPAVTTMAALSLRTPSEGAAAPAGAGDGTAAVSASPAAAAPAPAAVPAPAAAVGVDAGRVVFSARGTSWVRVTDASRAVVLERVLAAGESATAVGRPPLVVVVGKVDMTDVQVGGQPFALVPFARDNVARFEVR